LAADDHGLLAVGFPAIHELGIGEFPRHGPKVLRQNYFELCSYGIEDIGSHNLFIPLIPKLVHDPSTHT
jgi:hypothetical protein